MRDKIKFDLKYARKVLSGKKRATIRVGERKYTNRVKIYIGERYAGRAKVVVQFPFKIKNLKDWMVRKEGMSKKTLLKELARLYGKLTDKVFTFVEFKLEPVYFAGIYIVNDDYLLYIIDGSEKKVFSKKVKKVELLNLLKDFDPRVVAINCEKEFLNSHEPTFIGECNDAIDLAKTLKSKLKGRVILTNSKVSRRELRIKYVNKTTEARVCALVAYYNFLGETKSISGIKLPLIS